MNNENDIRRGMQQAKAGDTGLVVIVCQVIGASYMVSQFSGSTGLGAFTLVAFAIFLLVIAQNEKISRYFSFVAGGIVAVAILRLFILDDESSIWAGLIAAPIAGGIIAGGNLLGLQHLRDIGDKPPEKEKDQ